MLSMRRKVISMLPSMASVHSFKEFQSLCGTSNIEPGLDNTPISDGNVTIFAKEIREQIMSNDPNEDAIVAFKERMELLKIATRGSRMNCFMTPQEHLPVLCCKQSQ